MTFVPYGRFYNQFSSGIEQKSTFSLARMTRFWTKLSNMSVDLWYPRGAFRQNVPSFQRVPTNLILPYLIKYMFKSGSDVLSFKSIYFELFSVIFGNCHTMWILSGQLKCLNNFRHAISILGAPKHFMWLCLIQCNFPHSSLIQERLWLNLLIFDLLWQFFKHFGPSRGN